MVGGGINHVHRPFGEVCDVCEASIQREQDVVPLATDNDIGDDQIGCRINDGDEVGRFMYEVESSAIRGERALLRVGAHVDRGGGCERDRIENRHGSGCPVGNIGLESIR